MKTVITYGTFDLFHHGHVKLLERARALGDELIVAVSTDAFNAVKGKKCVHPYEHRREIVEAIRYVDRVIGEEQWDQKESDILQNGVDIFVMGDDWNGKFDHLSNVCQVTYLPRTEGISTTAIKGELASKASDPQSKG